MREKQITNRHIVTSILLLLSAAALIFFLYQGLQTNPNKPHTALLNKTAMPFAAEWLQGQEVLPHAADKATFNLDDLKGRKVILNFWASWCYSCRQEAHDLQVFWDQVKDQNVLVVGIAIQDSVEASLTFARKYGKTYILGLDTSNEIFINYGVTGVPETFLIDEYGTVVHKEAGPVNTQMLHTLLAEKFKN